MCLILFSYKTHKEYPLILLANRDEFYNRPTLPAQWWKEFPNVLAGKDLEGNGTWMGITRQGRFAAITNYRDPSRIVPNAPSRGALVLDFLTGTDSPTTYLNRIKKYGKAYNGFNLMIADEHQLYYYSNYQDIVTPLSPGIYGLSNALLDSNWPKVINGKSKLENYINENKAIFNKSILPLIQNREFAPEEELPDTGIGKEKEIPLSSMFIEMEGYGTRCSTAISINQNGVVNFTEESFFPENLFECTFNIGN